MKTYTPNPELTTAERIESLNEIEAWLQETYPRRREYRTVAQYRADSRLWDAATIAVLNRRFESEAELRQELRERYGWQICQPIPAAALEDDPALARLSGSGAGPGARA